MLINITHFFRNKINKFIYLIVFLLTGNMSHAHLDQKRAILVFICVSLNDLNIARKFTLWYICSNINTNIIFPIGSHNDIFVLICCIDSKP